MYPDVASRPRISAASVFDTQSSRWRKYATVALWARLLGMDGDLKIPIQFVIEVCGAGVVQPRQDRRRASKGVRRG
jgi:hypothetical protein